MEVLEKLALIFLSVIGFFALLLYSSFRFFWDFEMSERERERKKREEWFDSHKLAIKCGHPIGLDAEDGTEYCPRCLELMAIQCAFCGRPIFVGDTVGLYAPHDAFKIPKFGVEPYSSMPLEFVVCQRAGCAEKADPVGIWSPPGRIKKYNSF
jgi:hypothetical protein